jgi:hypothetical protein
MSERKRDLKPRNILPAFNGMLKCQRCETPWAVVDFNPERKATHCPICGDYNDTNEARKRAL